MSFNFLEQKISWCNTNIKITCICYQVVWTNSNISVYTSFTHINVGLNVIKILLTTRLILLTLNNPQLNNMIAFTITKWFLSLLIQWECLYMKWNIVLEISISRMKITAIVQTPNFWIVFEMSTLCNFAYTFLYALVYSGIILST